jgi:hypothetical protein
MVAESSVFYANVVFRLCAAVWCEVSVAFQILDYSYLCKYILFISRLF